MKPDTEERKQLQKRALDLGLGDFEDLSEDTKRAIEKGGYRIPLRSDRKGFSKSKRRYGHFSGYGFKGFDKQYLQERAELKSHETE